MVKYSVVTINIGSYEIVHEIEDKSVNAEYILITDDPNLTSRTWDIKLIKNKHPEDNFYTVFYIRYHIFDYINTDIAVVIDGSIGIKKNFDHVINTMVEQNKDCCLFLHNYNITLEHEYETWGLLRNYSTEQINKIKELVGDYWYYEYQGLYVKTISIIRNTKDIEKWNQLTFEYCQMLAYGESKVDRLDQTIWSYILNKYFADVIHPLCFPFEIINGEDPYFIWYNHGSNERITSDISDEIKDTFDYYVFNRKAELCKLLD